MNLFLAIAIVVISTAISIAAMLRVRRNAPDGSYFNDGDRAAGVLRRARHRVRRAPRVRRLPRLHQLRRGASGRRDRGPHRRATGRDRPAHAADVSGQLTNELVCYARSVAGVQWDRMQAGHARRPAQPWGVALFKTLERADPRDAGAAGGLQQVARRTIRPRTGEDRPHPRRRRRHPDPAVGRAVLHRRPDLRVHALLRRQR